MAFFGGKKESIKSTSSGSVSSENVNSATIITKGSKISGNIESNDTLHVDGEVGGDIIVNNMVVVGKSGIVNGNVKAQKVICNGKIDGFVECDSIEILQNAEVSYRIIAESTVIIDGMYNGEIKAKNVLVDTHGSAENKIQAKEIVVKGAFVGDLACELLTTKPSGKIKGNMFVKNILNEGGLVEGAIGQFKDIFSMDTQPKQEEITIKNDELQTPKEESEEENKEKDL